MVTLKKKHLNWLVVSTPLKNMGSSVGMMTFPIYEKIKAMFRTTHQIKIKGQITNQFTLVAILVAYVWVCRINPVTARESATYPLVN
jgi:hypothetical protein